MHGVTPGSRGCKHKSWMQHYSMTHGSQILLVVCRVQTGAHVLYLFSMCLFSIELIHCVDTSIRRSICLSTKLSIKPSINRSIELIDQFIHQLQMDIYIRTYVYMCILPASLRFIDRSFDVCIVLCMSTSIYLCYVFDSACRSMHARIYLVCKMSIGRFGWLSID